MTILKLAIDATGARQGAREFETAADQVGRSAEKAGKTVDIYFGTGSVISKSMDEASKKTGQFAKTVEAVGEVTQVQQRVRLLGEEVRNLGSGMGSAASIGQTLSGALIDIAQISGKVEGGFSGFIGLLRANPLLVAATVIGGIATAMSLFGDETKAANEDLQRQVQLQDELRRVGKDLELQIQRNIDLQRVGFDINQREQDTLRARRLTEAAATIRGAGPQSIESLSQLTGESVADLQARVRRQSIAQPTPSGPDVFGGFGIISAVSEDIARQLVLSIASGIRKEAALLEQGPGFAGILNLEQIRTLQGISRRSRDTGQQFGPPVPEGLPGVYGGNALPSVRETVGYGAPIGPQTGPGYMSPEELAAYQARFQAPGYEMRVAEEQERARLLAEELDRLNERLQQLKSLGQDVGTAIGGAFFSIVNGAANARQALAALLQQFVAIAQQRAIQGIANSIGNAFGASTQQQINNLQTPGTANTGISLRGGATP